MNPALLEALARLPRPLLVALDVDGVLAPIVNDPWKARVAPETQATLRTLLAHRDYRVALITGRAADSLALVIDLPEAFRAVEHGRRIAPPGEDFPPYAPSEAQQEALDRFWAWAQEKQPLGVLVERKPAAAAIHVRELAAKDEAAATALLAEAATLGRSLGLHLREGRALCEVEIEVGEKRKALDEIFARSEARSLIFIGDDLTDFPAIERAVDLGGLGIFVRSTERPQGPEKASFILDDLDQVAHLLSSLRAP